MRKIFYIILILMPLSAIASEANSQAAALAHYNDRLQLYYNYKAVCNFIDNYLDISKQLSPVELNNWQQKKYTRTTKVTDDSLNSTVMLYDYVYGGIEVEYFVKSDGSIAIEKIIYQPHRLPAAMHSKSFYLSTFELQGKKTLGNIIDIGCDTNALEATFSNDMLQRLTIKSTF